MQRASAPEKSQAPATNSQLAKDCPDASMHRRNSLLPNQSIPVQRLMQSLSIGRQYQGRVRMPEQQCCGGVSAWAAGRTNPASGQSLDIPIPISGAPQKTLNLTVFSETRCSKKSSSSFTIYFLVLAFSSQPRETQLSTWGCSFSKQTHATHRGKLQRLMQSQFFCKFVYWKHLNFSFPQAVLAQRHLDTKNCRAKA